MKSVGSLFACHTQPALFLKGHQKAFMRETTFCCSRILKETKATTFQKQKNMSQLTINLLALKGVFPIFPASFEASNMFNL